MNAPGIPFKPKKKAVKLSTLQAKADSLMSLYVRQKFAKDGYCECVSCKRHFRWQDMDCGHFIPKSRGASIRWVEENVAPECQGCNRFDEGHLIGFYEWMLGWYGKDTIDRLKRESRKTLSASQKRGLAEDAIQYYKTALEALNA
jgi:hypothetical protein